MTTIGRSFHHQGVDPVWIDDQAGAGKKNYVVAECRTWIGVRLVLQTERLVYMTGGVSVIPNQVTEKQFVHTN